MKKFFALMLALCMILTLCACGKKVEEPVATPEPTEEMIEVPATTEAPVEEAAPAEEAAEEAPAEETEEAPAEEEEVAVMSYAEYAAAELDSKVCVETYVQAHQSWWDNKVTVYSQDKDGAYFLYNMACSEEDAAKLVPGTKIKVTGYKSEWAGEVEVVDASFEFVEGDAFVAAAEDVTALLGTDDLINSQNKFVAFKGMTVEKANDDGAAFLYNWDGSGEEGNDLYFNVSKDGKTYSFVVESYLCGSGTEVYEAVKALNVGDVIDMEGFLYWYEGVNPHITSVKAAA